MCVRVCMRVEGCFACKQKKIVTEVNLFAQTFFQEELQLFYEPIRSHYKTRNWGEVHSTKLFPSISDVLLGRLKYAISTVGRLSISCACASIESHPVHKIVSS